MNRLATRTIAGKLPSEGGVGAGKLPVKVVAEPIEVDIGADRHRYSLGSIFCHADSIFRTMEVNGYFGHGRVAFRASLVQMGLLSFQACAVVSLVHGTRPVVCHRRIVCNR
jgi:hypothetical protein